MPGCNDIFNETSSVASKGDGHVPPLEVPIRWADSIQKKGITRMTSKNLRTTRWIGPGANGVHEVGGRPSRRQFLGWTALGTTGIALSACSRNNSSDTDEATLTVLDSGNVTADPPRNQVYEDYAGANPGIEFDIRALPAGGDWDQQARVSVQSGEDIDLLVINGQFVRAWVRDGLLAPLSNFSALEDVVGRIEPSVLAAAAVDDENYALPLALHMGVHATVFYHNRSLLDEAGLQPPNTLDDLRDMVEPLREFEASPMVHPSGDPFYNPLLVMWILPQVVSPEDPIQFVDETLRGNVAYDSDQWVEAFDLIARLSTEGVLLPGSGSVTPEAVPQYLFDRQVALVYDGTWSIPTFMDAPAEGYDLHVAALPAVGEGSARPLVAYVGSAFPAEGGDTDAATAFLQYAGDPDVDAQVTAGTQLMSPIPSSNDLLTSAISKEALPFLSKTIAPLDWLWEPEINQEMGSQVQALVLGSTSAREAGEALQATADELRRTGRSYY
jgi:ABC-type glycerol-3-phosphate transport system substrate-binding protein